MDRYAVLNKENVVVNVIVWDGIANWKPPEGHRVVRNEDCSRGDIWDEQLNDYLRPLKLLKLPEDEESINQRREQFLKSKIELKSSFLFLDDTGKIEI